MTTFTGHLTDAQAQRLADGALDPARDGEVELHAAGCAGCAALVASYRALAEALSGLEQPEVPVDFTAEVMARVEERSRAVARERRLSVVILGAAISAVAGVLLAAGAAGLATTASDLAEGLGVAARVLRLGADVVPAFVSAARLPLLLAAAAAVVPLLLALSRLMPSPRLERA
jgi:anti-sigma factor RsiW